MWPRDVPAPQHLSHFLACARGSRQDPPPPPPDTHAKKPNPACQAADQRCSCRMDLHASKCWCTKRDHGMGKDKINIPHHQHHWPIQAKMDCIGVWQLKSYKDKSRTNSTRCSEHRWQYCGELHNINSIIALQSCKEIKEQTQDNPSLTEQNSRFRLNGFYWLTCFGGRSPSLSYTVMGEKSVEKLTQRN